jgi:hypothetical protein
MIYESIQPARTNTDVDLEHLTCSAYLLCLDEDLNNPILSLDSSSRIAFLLHHLLGYVIEDATCGLRGINAGKNGKNGLRCHVTLFLSQTGHRIP